MILFIKHIDIEGPDTLDVFFEQQGIPTSTVELYNGDDLTEDLNGLDAVISLGGPMSVYDEDKFPFLKVEDQFIKKVLSQNIPFIGICLGSQILAKACGARINKSPEKEIGFLPIEIRSDALFEGLQEKLDVFHWHEDMSDLPSGATWLASSTGCPHQAYKVGPCAYGLQFHIEVTEPTIGKWTDKYFSKENSDQMQQKQQILEDYRDKEEQFHKTADIICNNFMNIIRDQRREQAYV